MSQRAPVQPRPQVQLPLTESHTPPSLQLHRRAHSAPNQPGGQPEAKHTLTLDSRKHPGRSSDSFFLLITWDSHLITGQLFSKCGSKLCVQNGDTDITPPPTPAVLGKDKEDGVFLRHTEGCNDQKNDVKFELIRTRDCSVPCKRGRAETLQLWLVTAAFSAVISGNISSRLCPCIYRFTESVHEIMMKDTNSRPRSLSQ